jgi:hypothetical protein
MTLLIATLMILGFTALIPWLLIGALNGLFNLTIAHTLINYVFAWVILFIIRAPIIITDGRKK